ncbi:MAG: RluA family pseudouridine synthase [Chloroflexi bacterium]|nr:RluA family pseudouridine synthase [Chloroflexota bacterium]MCL5110899.1 RluA family pseudouridine synthase [Chloroflexota bacterium]
MAPRRHRVDESESGQRLDRFLGLLWPDLSRSQWQRLVEQGRVLLDEKPAKPASKVEAGQEVVAEVPEPPPATLVPEEAQLNVVYEDGEVLVIDKPAGMVVHPAPGHDAGTLANVVIGRWQGEAGEDTLRPGIVHRLDKDTSGLMVVAKNPSAQANLAQQIARHEMHKQYLLLVHGRLHPEQGVIDAPIGRNPRERKRMAVVEGGREARTHYRVLELFDGYTLVEATLETGRTHQIRVHFQAIGYPVAGDPVYGVAHGHLPLGRQFLHSYRLGFRLPASGRYLELTSSLPVDLQECLDLLRQGVR